MLKQAEQRIAACDLGKAAAKFVTAIVSPQHGLRIESTEALEHHGKPMEAFTGWYRRANIRTCAALGATGIHAAELVEPVVTRLPEDACLRASLGVLLSDSGPVNIVRIGAQGYGVLTRDEQGAVEFLENEKCSSGTGETMVKIAGRFGLSIEHADQLAYGAEKEIPITARCSVFAKSEMTHFGNQGADREALFRGYFRSVAAYVAALTNRAKVPGPLFLIGGGSRLRSLSAGLSACVGVPVQVPEEALFFEAVGAAVLAAGRRHHLPPLPTQPTRLISPRQIRFQTLEPAQDYADRVTWLRPSHATSDSAQPTVLGLDLGSTGSKAVLTGIEDGEIVADVYDRTRGNPVDAAQRLVTSLLSRTSYDIRAIAITGSGREAAATVIRAAFPDQHENIIVLNEIVAHATAAITADPDRGRSISVVEIGGQDAKFIQIVDGQIVESDMNKACSAGTGSFLEEQAAFYGVDDIQTFVDLAQKAKRPPDLGQMCTVFVADAAAAAHSQGFQIPDLFGGFQYGVIHNYINRVMGQRKFGERIFFQGKPASGPALAWTLAAVTGREVVVPHNPGAMGAWGIGLCAREQLGIQKLLAADPFDLRTLHSAQVVKREQFQCKDRGCATLCRIERTTVEVARARKTVFSGGACPKYELPNISQPKLDRDAPNPMAHRRALLEPYVRDERSGPCVGIPEVGACAAVLPWLSTLVRELGFSVRILRASSLSLRDGEERCYAFDACAPAKLAHALARPIPDVDIVLFPKLLTLGETGGHGGATCPVEQALPDMVAAATESGSHAIPFLRPVLSIDEGMPSSSQCKRLLTLAQLLGAQKRRLPHAIWQAHRAQAAYRAALQQVGERALDYARSRGIPTVVLCGTLHVLHDRTINAGIPDLLRDNGVITVPMDCFPDPERDIQLPRIPWAEAKTALRTAVAARQRGDAYPLLLTSFGCGPGSFLEHLFEALTGGHPHTILESDAHGGAAGYATRIQAFLHTVRAHDGRPTPAPTDKINLLRSFSQPPINTQRGTRLVLASVSDRISGLMAAVYRSFGFDAVPAGPASARALALGRRDCSGKECLPYQLLWGSFSAQLQDNPPQKPTALLQFSGSGMCRNCMFSLKDSLALAEQGLRDTVAVRHIELEPELGISFMGQFWATLVCWDLLFTLASYHRPMESHDGEVDNLYHAQCDRLERILEEPSTTGRWRLGEARQTLIRLLQLLREASDQFAEVGRRGSPPAERTGAARRSAFRTVLLTGDIFLRLDHFGSDDLIRKLNRRGLRVIVEPSSALVEYTLYERINELIAMPTAGKQYWLARGFSGVFRHLCYTWVKRKHPWLPVVHASSAVRASRDSLNGYPLGEAPMTIGSTLHHWQKKACDGVVVVSPWGCGPALISESMLRHRKDIPTLFIYNDGSPLDERRLDAYAFRLHGDPIAC